MSRQYFGDPDTAFSKWMTDDAEYESRCPVCCECGNHITDEFYFEIDGNFYCEDCLRSNHRKDVEGYVREQEEI